MDKLAKLENHFTFEEAIGRTAIALVGHPFEYVKVLIQLGYEPIPPWPTKSLFGRPRLALPNVFTYLGYIRRQDGLAGVYRGFSGRLATDLVKGFVLVNCTKWQEEIFGPLPDANKKSKKGRRNSGDEDTEESQFDEPDTLQPFNVRLKYLIQKLSRETLSRSAAIIISHPFHVITIRMCAQFIGKETQYDTLWGAITDIYAHGNQSGLSCFYVGVVPRLIGEISLIWLSSGIVFMITSTFESNNSAITAYISACVNLLVNTVLYPFHLCSTVLAVNGPGAESLKASQLNPTFDSWREAWKYLAQTGQHKRGSSLIWRYHPEITRAALYSKEAQDTIRKGRNLYE